MSFDRLTHALWAGDVGQGDWEEVDLIERGANYGWRKMEGDACYNLPLGLRRRHVDRAAGGLLATADGCAVVGGFVYRGSRLPELYGAYVYGDYCSGKLWALRWDGTSATVQPLADERRSASRASARIATASSTSSNLSGDDPSPAPAGRAARPGPSR